MSLRGIFCRLYGQCEEELCDLLVTLSEWSTLHMPSLKGGRLPKKRSREAVAA